MTAWSQDTSKRESGLVFTLPAVPSMLRTPESRADYLVEHYWEGFSFSDERYLSNKDRFEQIFVDFINILPVSNKETAKKATLEMIRKAYEKPTLESLFVEMSDKYLYDPNSPSFNEETYLWVLEALLAQKLTPTSRYRYANRQKLLTSNRIGNVATDFSVLLSTGKKMCLSDIQTDYTLIFFNNPDCDDCKRVKREMERSASIKSAVEKKKMTVLAVYPDGDLPLWKGASYPSFMLNGFDEGMSILKGGLYDLKAMPTLYLLDKDRRVLLRDATLDEVLSRIDKMI